MDSNLVTVAGVMLGVGVAILLFRLARELYMGEQGERNWLAYSDRLVVGMCILTLVVLLLPVLGVESRRATVLLSRSAILGGFVMLLGWVLGILAHYRFIGGKGRPRQRDNPEPLERTVVLVTTGIALLAVLGGYLL